MRFLLWTALFIGPLAAAVINGVAHPLLEEEPETETEVINYDEYLSLIMQQQDQEEEEQQQRDKRQTDYCNLIPLNVTIHNDEGCPGYVPVYGCAGKCLSTDIPNHFMSR